MGMHRPIGQLQTLRDKFDIDQTAIAAANIKRPGLRLVSAQARPHILRIIGQFRAITRCGQCGFYRHLHFLAQGIAGGQNTAARQRHMLPIPCLMGLIIDKTAELGDQRAGIA